MVRAFKGLVTAVCSSRLMPSVAAARGDIRSGSAEVCICATGKKPWALAAASWMSWPTASHAVGCCDAELAGQRCGRC